MFYLHEHIYLGTYKEFINGMLSNIKILHNRAAKEIHRRGSGLKTCTNCSQYTLNFIARWLVQRHLKSSALSFKYYLLLSSLMCIWSVTWDQQKSNICKSDTLSLIICLVHLTSIRISHGEGAFGLQGYVG